MYVTAVGWYFPGSPKSGVSVTLTLNSFVCSSDSSPSLGLSCIALILGLSLCPLCLVSFSLAVMSQRHAIFLRGKG